MRALVLVMLACSAQAQDPQPFYQPENDYYGAIGSRVTVEMKATPTTLTVNSAIQMELIVRGATNPPEVKAPVLKDLPEFATRFTITPLGSMVTSNELVIRYELRPRHADVTKIPRLRFSYYQPNAIEGQKYPTTYSESIPITVIATSPTPVTTMPLAIHWPEEPRGLKLPHGPEAMVIAAVLVFGLTAVYVQWWRRAHPDALEFARLRRIAAVRTTLAALDSATDASAVAQAFLSYFHTRHNMAPVAIVPGEVESALLEMGYSTTSVAPVTQVLKECDAVRYGRANDSVESLVQECKRLVMIWESPPP